MAEKANKAISLLRLAEERALLRKEVSKQQVDSVPYLPTECVSNILIRLPIESLQCSRFVCKPWYKIINCPLFIDANLRRAETVLIFQCPPVRSAFKENPNTFSVEAKIFQLKSVHLLEQPLISPMLSYSIKFMVIADGKSKVVDYNATCLGRIRASCNGLIVLDYTLKKGELVIMNPVTREVSLLPPGTIYPPHEESYGLAFCESSGRYKLVHLFRDEMQFIGCEILEIGAKSWRDIDGPSFGLLTWFGYEPVAAIGALHWVPDIDHSEHIVSMTIDDEKFHKIPLPKSCRFNDRLMEVSEHLCFVTHEEMNETNVWILKSLLSGEEWTKIYTIAVGCIRDMVPLYCSRLKWEMYFMDKDGSILTFDFQNQVMRKVERKKEYFPIQEYHLHVNSLVSWRIKENDQDSIDRK